MGIYLHYIWSTKNRYPYLSTPEIREIVWEHIRCNAITKDIDLIAAGGHKEHCHCLVSFRSGDSISKIAGLIKGESSHWINKTGLIKAPDKMIKFQWQIDYYVKPIQEHILHSVIHYIQTQEEHHKKVTFKEELEKFLREYSKEIDKKLDSLPSAIDQDRPLPLE